LFAPPLGEIEEFEEGGRKEEGRNNGKEEKDML
jgi:hypothetical protein